MGKTLSIEKVNKKILKLLTGVYPDFVQLDYLYRLRKHLQSQNLKSKSQEEK